MEEIQELLREQGIEIRELRHAIVDDDSITDHKEILEFAEDLRDAYDKICKIGEDKKLEKNSLKTCPHKNIKINDNPHKPSYCKDCGKEV